MFLHLDEEEDDIEDYGFALDLDDILAGSSPTRRIASRHACQPADLRRPPPELRVCALDVAAICALVDGIPLAA